MTPSMTIVAMQPCHLAQVVAIEAELQFSPWSDAMFQSCLGGRYHALVMLLAETVVGYCIFDAVLDEGTLHNIAVKTDYQGQALASQLLLAGLQWAEQQQLSQIFLEVRESNLPARRLYEKYAFNEIGRRKDYYPTAIGREHAIVMQRELR